MKSVDQIRIARLAMLVADVGGVTSVATVIKRSASQVSQWLNASPDSRTQKPRAISNASARYIEQQCGLPFGWMDQPLDVQGTGFSKAPVRTLPSTDSPEIAAVIALMRATDDRGRAMVLGAVKGVLTGYVPAHQANGVR